MKVFAFISTPRTLPSALALLLCSSVSLCFGVSHEEARVPNNHPPLFSKIRPYQATYDINYNGTHNVLERSLKKTNSAYWELNNSLSLLLFGFTEQAIFKAKNDRIIPLLYDFDHGLNTSKDSSLSFNWSNSTVTDAKRKLTRTISPGTQDVLSFQLQLRLDLLKHGDNFTEKNYTLFDKKRFKEYSVRHIGEETLATPAGRFLAVKLEQRRKGKKDYSHIWLAKNKDYFLLRIERIKDKTATYSLQLSDVKIDGAPLRSQ